MATYAEDVDNLTDADSASIPRRQDAFNAQIADPDALYFPQRFHLRKHADDRHRHYGLRITIEKDRWESPIWLHGTSDGVLQVVPQATGGHQPRWAARAPTRSFPAHRGLPSAKLFTNLDQLEGDTFTITVLTGC